MEMIFCFADQKGWELIKNKTKIFIADLNQHQKSKQWAFLKMLLK